jgi:hypothetical protein
MNRNHHFSKSLNLSFSDVNKKIAIHEAGHAAAIYLANREKELPPVFFHIIRMPMPGDFNSTQLLSELDAKCIAKIEGGRLINSLPFSIEDATQDFTYEQKKAYQRAFEADMVNMLVGPLAEAKYVALRDGELINSHLINPDALRNYGGSSDLDSVNDYLECFAINPEQKQQKLMELFLAAFSFITNNTNWRAINALADYIVKDNNQVIECGEIISILESATNQFAC